MSEQKCRYFEKKRFNISKILIEDEILYCCCADIFKVNGIDVARSACKNQIGEREQDWYEGATYWKCSIGDELLKNRVEEDSDNGTFSAARSYIKSVSPLLSQLGLHRHAR